MSPENSDFPKQDFKDLFSTQAADYAQFRPRYPAKLFEYLSTLSLQKHKVWDCGTGNGQAAVELAKFFDSVIATDASEKQIFSAEHNSKVNYQLAPAEHSPLPDQSVDLITAAQAFHWFKHEAFFEEVRRVLRPDGAIAIWCYAICTVNPKVDQAVHGLYEGVLANYWEPERRFVEEGYRNNSFPFDELVPPAFEMRVDWSVDQLLGYFGTWSSLQSYVKKNGHNPLEEHAPLIREAWGTQKTREVRWPLFLRVGKLKK